MRRCQLEVEFEVELPGADTRGKHSILIRERESQLDDFQQIHIHTEGLKLVIGRAGKNTRRKKEKTKYLAT